jgi:hypothetical protein
MVDGLKKKEPISTGTRFVQFMVETKAVFDSYSWTVGEGAPGVPFLATGREGASDTSLMQIVFPGTVTEGSGGVNNPYAGGKLVYDPSLFETGKAKVREANGGTREIEITACNAHVTYTLGASGLVIGFCTVLNLVKLVGFDVWLNFFLTIGCIVLFFKYFAAELVIFQNVSNLMGK